MIAVGVVTLVAGGTPSAIGNVRIVEAITSAPDAGQYAYHLRAQHEDNPGEVHNEEFLDPVRLEGGRGFDVADGVAVTEQVQQGSPSGLVSRFLRFMERVLPIGWA